MFGFFYFPSVPIFRRGSKVVRNLLRLFDEYECSEMSTLNSPQPSAAPSNSKDSLIWGWIFIFLGFTFFLGFVFAGIICKLLPPFSHPVLSAIQDDRYYTFLVPLTLPILVFAVYFHWLSMKLFKHA